MLLRRCPLTCGMFFSRACFHSQVRAALASQARVERAKAAASKKTEGAADDDAANGGDSQQTTEALRASPTSNISGSASDATVDAVLRRATEWGMGQVHSVNGLQTKLCLESFRLTYVTDTADVFVRHRKGGASGKNEDGNGSASSSSSSSTSKSRGGKRR